MKTLLKTLALVATLVGLASCTCGGGNPVEGLTNYIAPDFSGSGSK